MSDQVDVKPDPSSALVQAVASSPEVKEEAQQVQETQTPTAEPQGVVQEPEVQEEARVPYSRLKEVVDEKNWFKSQLEQQMAQRQQVLQQQPTQDPYQGMTAEEKVFFQGIDKRIEERASQIADQKIRQISPVIDAGRMELAQIKVQQFRNQHPDIKSNSPEEIQIAEKISQGYVPDDAYWAVMGPRGMRAAKSEVQQQFKQQVAAKRQANVETSGSVPAGAKPAPKKTYRETFLEALDREESRS